MTGKLAVVVTTIQPPTASMRALAGRLAREGASLLVVGDAAGPREYDLAGARLLSLEAQRSTPFRLARSLPTGHYARKNLGYLQVISEGAGCIYETDDDNHPLPSWAPRSRTVHSLRVNGIGWTNVYRHFSDELVWPRGFPLDRIHDRQPLALGPEEEMEAPIQQGLADGSPDVDAVWRLVLDRDVRFRSAPPVFLPPGSWCPFNSQSTWWWPEAWPLLYLPSSCSFRMTDIWRSLVAQRCLWELGLGVVFHAPEVEQARNEHDLVRDLGLEVPGYLGNRRIASLLEGLPLSPGAGAVAGNLLACHEALVREGFLEARELPLVRAWLDDLQPLLDRRLSPSSPPG